MEEKTVRSAVIIMPPVDMWDQIQAVRLLHDKAYVRWMPHINLLYPFVAEEPDFFQDAITKLKAGLQKDKIKPFQVVFGKESFGYFKHRKSCVVWLKPLYIEAHSAEAIIKPLNLSDIQIMQDKKEHGEKKQNEPKKLVESTVTDKKQKFAENITVVEPIQEKPYSQVGTVVGIDALKDAVYSEKELVEQRKMPDKMAPGLDCLRYAEWTDELNKSIDDVLDFGVGQTVLNKYTHKFYGGNYVEVDYSKCESKQSKEDIQDDWETVLPKTKSKSTVVKQMEKTTKQKEVTDADQTPPVTKLQSALLKAFPNCNDLNVKSEAGFQAHLTLGQCDTQNVNTFIEDIKRNWRDICFTVSSIYVISRRKADPFEIRHEVKFEV